MRKKVTSILSGWDNILPGELDKNQFSGMLTIPEILTIIKNYDEQVTFIKEMKRILEEHILNNDNPHFFDIDIENYHITYNLYQEYLDKHLFVGSFEDFVDKLFNRTLGVINDLNDPIANRTKLVTLEMLHHVLDEHEQDPNAHAELLNSLDLGEIFDVMSCYHTCSKNPDIVNNGKRIFIRHRNGYYKLIEYPAPLITYVEDKPAYLIFDTIDNLLEESDGPTGWTIPYEGSINPNPSNKGIFLTNDVTEFSESTTSGKYVISKDLSGCELTLNRETRIDIFFSPRGRHVFGFKLNTNIEFEINFQNESITILINDSGESMRIKMESLETGYYKITCIFINTFNVSNLSIHTKMVDQGQIQHQGNGELACVISHVGVVEWDEYPLPNPVNILTNDPEGQSYLNDINPGIIPNLENYRTQDQGTILVSFMKPYSAADTYKFSFIDFKKGDFIIEGYIDGDDDLIHINVTLPDGDVLTHTVSFVPNIIYDIVISYGTLGAVIAINGNTTLLGDIEGTTSIPEIDAYVDDTNMITVNDYQRLSDYPIETVRKLSDITESAQNNIFSEIVSYLAAQRDESSGAVVALDFGGQQYHDTFSAQVPIGPNDNAIFGNNLLFTQPLNGYIYIASLWDIAVNINQIKFLMNKFVNIYGPLYNLTF